MLAELVPELDARLSDPKNVAVCFVFIFHPLKLPWVKH